MGFLGQMPMNSPNASAFSSRASTPRKLSLSLQDSQSATNSQMKTSNFSASTRQLTTTGVIQNWLSQCTNPPDFVEDNNQEVTNSAVYPSLKSIRFDERTSSSPSLLALFAAEEEHKVNLLHKTKRTTEKNVEIELQHRVSEGKLRGTPNAGDARMSRSPPNANLGQLSSVLEMTQPVCLDSRASSTIHDWTSMTSSDWGDETCVGFFSLNLLCSCSISFSCTH